MAERAAPRPAPDRGAPPSTSSLDAADDQALLARARRGDGEAMGLLYDRRARDVERFLAGLRLGLPAAELQDAVQETFLRLLGRLDAVDPERPVRPFLLGIARHVALDLQRRRASGPTTGDAAPDERAPSDEGPIGQADAREERALVHEALGALEPEDRLLLVLRHVNGLTMQELADAIDRSVPTARARLRAAAARFARELARRGIPPREEVLS